MTPFPLLGTHDPRLLHILETLVFCHETLTVYFYFVKVFYFQYLAYKVFKSLFPPLFPHPVCIPTLVSVCLWWGGGLGVLPAHMVARGWSWVSSFISLHVSTIFFDLGPFIKPRIHHFGKTRGQRILTAHLPPPSTGTQMHAAKLDFHMGSQDQNSGPYASVAITLPKRHFPSLFHYISKVSKTYPVLTHFT